MKTGIALDRLRFVAGMLTAGAASQLGMSGGSPPRSGTSTRGGWPMTSRLLMTLQVVVPKGQGGDP
jgi:hypothetical protein